MEILDRNALGAAGRARVVERFTWRAAAARTAQVYRRAIADHARGER